MTELDGDNTDFTDGQPADNGQQTGPSSSSTRKNRKINRSAGQLKRNAACVPCRKRRVKCDGAKPTCSSCTRSFHFLARTQPDDERDAKGIQCWYDDGDEPDSELGLEQDAAPLSSATVGQKRKADESWETDQARTIQHLELKVAELQNALRDARAGSSRPSSTHWTPPSNPSPVHLPYSGSLASAELPTAPISTGSVSTTSLPTPYPQWPPVHQPAYPMEAPSYQHPRPQPLYSHEHEPHGRMDAEAGQLGGPFVELFWPGWPKRLPTPTMMDHLFVFVTFFNTLPAFGRLIHRQAFQARLALPPLHADFPHPALLHAICASAARYSAAVKVYSVQELVEKSLSNPPEKNAPGQSSSLDEEAQNEPCFAERHWKYCNMELRYDNCQGTKLFDILLAQVILMQYVCQTAKWLDGWIIVGIMTRTAIALGLLDEPEQGGETVSGVGMLPPPKNDWEREERRAVAAEIIACDLQYSASGSWPGTLPSLDEMHFRLPASKADFLGFGPIPDNPQTVNSPDLFKSHPIEDGFVMYIKASLLLGRVSRFSRKLRHMTSAEKIGAALSPEFKQIDADLSDFSRSFPSSLRDPVQSCPGYINRIDTDLINAHLIHHVASILLHLPFADFSNPKCPSAKRLLVESRACLSVLYQIMSTRADMALMLYPITSVWLYQPARTLLMFYQQSLELGDRGSAKTLCGEIEVFQMAFAALGNRFPMGAAHCGMIDTMVRRIHEEYGIPEQDWRWSPSDWSHGQADSSALNYQAGMRSRNPRLPLLPKTHPDGAAWAEESEKRENRRSYREIIDQQRAYAFRQDTGAQNRPKPHESQSHIAGLVRLAEASAKQSKDQFSHLGAATIPVVKATVEQPGQQGYSSFAHVTGAFGGVVGGMPTMPRVEGWGGGVAPGNRRA